MLIIESRVDSPILHEALERVPDMSVTHEEQYVRDDGTVRFIIWATGSDFGAFESALKTDPTVTAPAILVELPQRRLYRLDFTDTGEEVGTFKTWSEYDIVIRKAVGMSEGWEVQWAVPDRAALDDLREEFRLRDVPFELQAIYELVDETNLNDTSLELTALQRETLVTAYERGYYAVPRTTDLGDLAASLGVSPQAVSERLRRATANLIHGALDLDN